jgi:hypothetical protein
VADDTPNWTIECPVFAQILNRSSVLTTNVSNHANQRTKVVRITDPMLLIVLIKTLNVLKF